MPSETAAQSRVWMAFPPARTAADDPEGHPAALTAWSAVANAIVRFEPVTMVVNTGESAIALPYLDAAITVIEAPLDDAWMRDIGPSFVLNENGEVGGVDWIFNGWGQQFWAEWQHDSAIGALVVKQSGATLISSPIVNEGGGIAVDGLGTVIVTESVQLDPYRNPSLTKHDIEAELARTIGATHVIWLPRGLTRDAEKYGTRGHVDIVAAIPSPGVLLVHSQPNPQHPDHEITRDAIALLRETTDAAGTPWRIIEIPAPTVVRDDEGWVDYSYINHLVINGAVIACSFDDPGDEIARQLLAAAYPGREIVTVDARAIFARGGGIHCITQNEPAGL
jgi:agmatine deiminase